MGLDAASGLADALAARGAQVIETLREGHRSYVTADGLFGRASSNPRDEAVFAHEVAVREAVGVEGPLRAPAVLDRGPGWFVEQRIEHERAAGPEVVAAIARAAEALATLELPEAPVSLEPRRLALVRRARALFSVLPMKDYLAARRVLSDPGLPVVTSHGDFHARNVLVERGQPWVVDWELSGKRPAGYDLLTFWPTLTSPDDRAVLWEAAVGIVGKPRELAGLRYALAVRAATAMLVGPRSVDRAPEQARELLALLPELRAEAGM
jgi:hypothetical protein